MIKRNTITSKLTFFAVGLGSIALLSSFIIVYVAYNNSIDEAEKNLYKFYTDKAQLIHAIIDINTDKSEAEILDIINKTYRLQKNRPDDEYVCIVDKNSDLILHTMYPQTVGKYAGSNKVFGETKKICTLNDLVINKLNYTGNYISSSGDEQIAAFDYVSSHHWTIGVHRSKKQLLNEIKSQYKWFKVAFLIISGVFLPLSLGLLFWASKISHKRETENNVIAQQKLEQNNALLKEAVIQAEHKAIELNEQKLLFETMFDTITEGIVITNTDREILLANKGITATFGYSPEEVIGKSTQIFYADMEKFDQTGIDIFNKNSVNLDKQYITNYKDKNNKIFPGETFGAKLFNSEGEWIGNLGIMRNISERIKLIEDTQKAKEKAEESDRLKTAFLQNMSHEIRTPLNAISGFSGMLNKPELSEEKKKSFVSIIQNSSKQLVAIVSDILTISSLETKQEKANIDKVCINNIIVDLLTIFKQQAQNQNITLYAKQQLNDRQSEIYTDKTKITQILSNLLTNALKFTHEGFIEFGYNLKNSELEFYVKDSGIGLKPEFHEKIFERFRQADESTNKVYGGTGLGLAISKAFVELLGGKIWIQSEHEQGSTFYFTVPYNPVNEIDKITSPTKQNENHGVVLVAEDEEYNFLFIEELLIDMNLKLIHAKDGQETVEIFKANPNIDLILMDIKMPGMTGYEAAKIIKELKPDLPIVAQSAYALEHERAKYEGIFDEYLTKPIREEILKQMVMKYISIQEK